VAACHIFSDAKVAALCRDGYRNVLHGPSRVESQFTHLQVSRREAIERFRSVYMSAAWAEMGAA